MDKVVTYFIMVAIKLEIMHNFPIINPSVIINIMGMAITSIITLAIAFVMVVVITLVVVMETIMAITEAMVLGLLFLLQ